MGDDASAQAEGRRRLELAWAAGFFDGEGWANSTRARGRRTSQPKAQINQAGTDGVPEVLIRFRDALGVGRVGGPSRKRGRKDLYWWIASSPGDVTRTFELLSPWLGELKRAEFRRATGVAESVPGPSSFAEETAWAAGLFDGEGWTGLEAHGSHEGFYAIQMGITQSSDEGAPEVLARFAALAERGRIYGPYRGDGGRKVYRWKVYGLDNVEATWHLLAPWVGVVKRDQARAALDVLRVQPALPRGNPAWGPSHKRHCVNGHDYATARVRAYQPRSEDGIQRRSSKQCLVCSREQAKARREAARTRKT